MLTHVHVRLWGLSRLNYQASGMSANSHEPSLRYWMGTIRYVKSGAVIARKALLRVASAARLGLAADRRGPGHMTSRSSMKFVQRSNINSSNSLAVGVRLNWPAPRTNPSKNFAAPSS